MYPIDAFWNNKRAVNNLQTSLINWLKTKYLVEAKAMDPIQMELPDAKAFNQFVMMRLSVGKESVGYGIGCQGDSFFEDFSKLVAPQKPDRKTVEVELVKLIFECVECELKSNQVVFDAKSVRCVNEGSLFGWKSIPVTQVVQIPLTSPKGSFVFEIPVTDETFQRQYIQENLGLRPQARIMVVDDSGTSRKLSMSLLNLAGYQNIDECADGQAALTKLSTSRPPFDLVVADWHMPNMSGFELLQKIRADENLKATCVVLVTGERNAAEVTNAIKAGVNGYVVKPLEPSIFYGAIKKAVAPKIPSQKKVA